MTPVPKSGGSAKPELTIKQQRAAKRAAKLDKYRKQLERDKRRKRIGLIVGIAGATAIAGLLFVAVRYAPRPASYEAGGSGAQIAGVETFQNTAVHVDTAVAYPQTPPAGGQHSPVWLNCGVYSEPVPSENAVHSQEHGAVWLTYDPAQIGDEQVSTLRSLMPATYAILSPFEGMDSAIAISGWNAQLKLDSLDEQRVAQFFEEYWLGDNAPEPGASCTGGIDGPGKVG